MNTFDRFDRPPQPLGIPGIFIADPLGRGRSPAEFISGCASLLREYTGVTGYVFDWGQMVEQRFGGYVLWRIIPVSMWENLTDARTGSRLLIDDLLGFLHPVVRGFLTDRLPAGAVLTGCQGRGRRSPHALFSVLHTDPATAAEVRDWLTTRFPAELLPDLLAACEAAACEARLTLTLAAVHTRSPVAEQHTDALNGKGR
jgi:hypothetical protein